MSNTIHVNDVTVYLCPNSVQPAWMFTVHAVVVAVNCHGVEMGRYYNITHRVFYLSCAVIFSYRHDFVSRP